MTTASVPRRRSISQPLVPAVKLRAALSAAPGQDPGQQLVAQHVLRPRRRQPTTHGVAGARMVGALAAAGFGVRRALRRR